MSYDFSSFDQMGASAQMRDYLTKIYPYLLAGGKTNDEYTYFESESLKIDKQYYFTINKFSNYPDFPKMSGTFATASAQTTRLGVSLNDNEMRPFLLINNVSTSGDFEISSMRLYINKLHSKEINMTDSYNFMLEAINKGDTAYYCRTMTIYQRYDNNHTVDGAPIVYSSGSRKDDDVHGASYWLQRNWSRYGGNYSDYDYFDYSPVIPEYPFLFDAVINSPSYGWKFDTNIPIFDNLDSAMKWVIDGDRSEEIRINPSCDFGLWIDGTNSPSYKVNWHIQKLEEEGYNFDNAVVKIGVGERTSSGVYHHTLTEKPYNDGSVRFTWFDFEDLGVKASLLSPWLNLNAQVILEEGTIIGTPTIDLRQKAPNFDGMYRDNTIGEDGSQFIVSQGSGEDSDDYHDPEDDEDAGQTNTDMNVSGAVISCYKISRTELHKLSQELWASDFIDNIRLVNNNPIENIVSLKSLPIAISGGTSEHIKLGNVETTASGNKCNESYSIEVGSLEITGRYGNFLDYAPFTSVNIYLPFIGMQSLDTNIVMNRTISVKYIVDCVTGSLRVKISSNGRALYEFNGCIGVDLPISSSNRAQVEMGLLSSGLGMVGSVASGNLVGAVGSGLAMANSQYHTQTSGTASAVIGFHDVRECFIRIDSPVYEELKDFNKTHGRMCNLSLNLNSLRGFTKVADGVELNNIPCTNEEKELIHDYLINGIII